MHTSGPWKVRHHHGGAAVTVETEAGDLIAQIYDEHVDAEANARLIAQAPAMADELRSMRDRQQERASAAERIDAILEAIDGTA